MSGLTFIICGLAFITIGVWILWDKRRKLSVCSARTQAELLRYEEETMNTRSDDGRRTTTTYYYPVFSYFAEGAARVVRYGIGAKNRKWNPGDQVRIHYDPQRPDTLYVSEGKSSWVLFAAAVAVGLLCLAFGVLLMLGITIT